MVMSGCEGQFRRRGGWFGQVRNEATGEIMVESVGMGERYPIGVMIRQQIQGAETGQSKEFSLAAGATALKNCFRL